MFWQLIKYDLYIDIGQVALINAGRQRYTGQKSPDDLCNWLRKQFRSYITRAVKPFFELAQLRPNTTQVELTGIRYRSANCADLARGHRTGVCVWFLQWMQNSGPATLVFAGSECPSQAVHDRSATAI